MLGYVLLTTVAAILFFGVLFFWAGRRGMIITQPWRPSGRRRIPLLTESLGYLGVLLVLASVGAGLGERWNGLASWQRSGALAVIALVLLAIGLWLRQFTDRVAERFTGFCWFVSTAAAAAAVGVGVHELGGQAAAGTAIAVGATVTAYSTALWLLRRRELQMMTFFAGLIVVICASVPAVSGAALPWLTVPLGLWMLGIAWAILGWQYPDPLWTSLPFGAVVALVAPAAAIWRYDWMFATGIATAAAVMVASVRFRSRVLLAFGAVAEFGYLTAALVYYSRGLLGIPESLAITGAILLLLAALSARLRRAIGGGQAQFDGSVHQDIRTQRDRSATASGQAMQVRPVHLDKPEPRETRREHAGASRGHLPKAS
ncbi:MAG: hypothetical protein ACYCO9_03615 [Streptosporangiaceae bacterium]